LITQAQPLVAVVIPVGPGKDTALDTLASVEAYCPEPHVVFVLDDQTKDGTYEALMAARKPHWHILRNQRRQGIARLVHSLSFAYEQVLARSGCKLILRLDQDALLIKPGLLAEALAFMETHPSVGLFGVYEVDYNRPRCFEPHRRLFSREAAWYRPLIGRRPSWSEYLRLAESKGYVRGDNVFGGAYFMTRGCLEGIRALGALKVPWHWHSQVQEDVYFSMVAMAAGFRLGQFAAPDGPLCMEWRGLPMPAAALAASKFKLVHSVDKGLNTGPAENGGRTAREVFRDLRAKLESRGEPCRAWP
jgi:glycosyltransferase involved in cell wall biosynthesis